jgi:hypothetical protein
MNVQANNFQDRVRLVRVPASADLQTALVPHLATMNLHGEALSRVVRPHGVLQLCGPLRHMIAASADSCNGSGGGGGVATDVATNAGEDGTGTTGPYFAAACMTNPPFYDQDEPVQSSNLPGWQGAAWEMRTPGGELAFLSAMVLDSLVLGTRIGWYTCLMGQRNSIKPLYDILVREGVVNIRCCSFKPGRSIRWALAWSFTSAGVKRLRPSGQYSLKFCLARGAKRRALELAMEGLQDYQEEWECTVEDFCATTLAQETAALCGTDGIVAFTPALVAARGPVAALALLRTRMRSAVAGLEHTGGSLRLGRDDVLDDGGGASLQFQYVLESAPLSIVTANLTCRWTSADCTAVRVVCRPHADLADVTAADPGPGPGPGPGVPSEHEHKAVFFRMAQQIRSNMLRSGRRWRRLVAGISK